MTDTARKNDCVFPVSGLSPETRQLIERVRTTKQPLLLTQDGKDAAVVVEAGEYERLQRRLALHQLILEGNQDVTAGRTHTQEEVEAMMDEWFGRGK